MPTREPSVIAPRFAEIADKNLTKIFSAVILPAAIFSVVTASGARAFAVIAPFTTS